MSGKVLLGPSSFAEADPAPLRRLAGAGFEPVANPFRRRLSKAELLDLLTPDVVGLIAGLESVDREVLSRSRLKAVSRVGAGIENVDRSAAAELGIQVRWTPDAPTQAVAELALGALLGLLRMIPRLDQDLRQGRWTKRIGGQLEGRTVAIVGFGRIGRRFAALLAPFRVKLLAVDPCFDPDSGLPAIRRGLDEALAEADVVSLHCSGARALIGRRELALMKPGALLLNAARGGLVDEEALAEALAGGGLGGAWLDAFAQEPYNGRLIGLPNVLLTPHVGSYTAECRVRMETEAVENLLDALGRAAR